MATSIRAAPRQFAPDSQSTLPQTANRHVNYLSTQPRLIVNNFDNDGPGSESPFGPRHDNDHVYIKDIQILPSTDEILSSDPPYMPKKNLDEPHFLPNGPMRHFDILFRHLRFDSIEVLRDTCYHAAQNLAVTHNDSQNTSEPQQDTPAGNRYFAYRDVRLEEVNAQEKKGMMMRFSYNCPELMRGRLMHNCTRLREGMLCALVCLDETSSELSIIFTEIHQRQSTTSMNSLGGLGVRAAIELSFPTSASYDDVLAITRQAQRLTSPKMVLVEFPKVLYAGFYWTLRRLQQMSPNDVAFLNYIAPTLNGSALLNNVTATREGRRNLFTCQPPSYARASGFAFELDPITTQPASYSLSHIQDDPASFEAFLKQQTSLDDGQAGALHQILTHEFAFTQGPPGTGKTFLGIALARTSLASRTGRPKKPLLVVCQTNHALDSFLSGLRDAGVEKLIRIGSNSKEEWTKAISLREKSSKLRVRVQNPGEQNEAWQHKQATFSDLDSWCKGLNAERTTENLSWHAVRRHLSRNFLEIHEQFITASTNKYTEVFTYDYWAAGGDLQNLKDLQIELSLRLLDKETKRSPSVGSPPDVEQILTSLTQEAQRRSHAAGTNSVWNIPLRERKALLSSWRQNVDRDWLAEHLTDMHLKYIEATSKMREFLDEKDAAALLEADVIGMTTTASATRWSLLKMLNLETLICEEAGEVLEAHSLCSMLPTLEHAIFIGDPLQLRPEVSEQSMSLETMIGRNYRLNESMFERFMLPLDPAASQMPTSQLNVQRRMHPDVADITRLTYPNLLDHTSTSLHLPVSGVAKRMFWLNHRVPELDAIQDSKSHTNIHEVRMVTGLVRYLLTQSTYSLGDIAVLTPYNGQLAALVESLQTSCAVWLCPKDREAMLEDGTLPLESEKDSGLKENITMANLLRIATIDNFQGEEAKVIILSTVRSGGRPGFLKTANRANVACSRARDGFFIVGNAQTLQQVPFWREVVGVFERQGSLGSSLRLCCDRHPNHNVDVAQPSDFTTIRCCNVPCSIQLACKHICFEGCHDPAAHDRIPCRKPCQKILPCGHKCSRSCFEKCGTCQYRVGEQTLACNHQVAKLCSGSTPDCQVVIRKQTLSCNPGHVVEIRCSDKDHEAVCPHPCSDVLGCGHTCKSLCRECSPEGKHPPCSELCGKQLPKCNHRCVASCHWGEACRPCNQPCEDTCEHGPCKNLCNRICDPCVKPYVGERQLFVVAESHMLCSLGHIVNHPDRFENVLDRLIAKMGRKFVHFAVKIAKQGQELHQSLDPLLRSIRPNCMSALQNKEQLAVRGTELRALLRDLADFREHVVEPFEKSIASIRQSVPDVSEYALMFHPRFEILEYRARAVLIHDGLTVARLLIGIQDASMGVQRQAAVLQTDAVQNCLKGIEYCQGSLDRHTAASPSVQVELLLQEVQFTYMADVLSETTKITGGLVSGLLQKAMLLCRRYPSTAGAFLDNIRQFQNYNRTGDATTIPPVTNTKTRKVEKALGQHTVGHLTTCTKKHPYSAETFPQGCPECGPKVEFEEEVFHRSQKFLHEDDFLQAMKRK